MINRKPLVYRLTEGLFLVFIALHLVKRELVTTAFKLGIPKHIDRMMIMLIAGAALARLAVFLFNNRSEGKRWIKWIAAALMTDAVYFMVYMEHHHKFLVFLAVLTLGTVGMEYDRIIRAYIAVTALILASAVMMAWCGGITNYVYIRGVELRSAWGIGYPTELASYFFFLAMFLWATCRKTRGLWFLVPGVVVLVLSDYVAGSRTCTVCCIAFLLAVCAEYVLFEGNLKDRFAGLRRLLARPAEILLCSAFPVLTIVMNALVFAYRRGNSVITRIDQIMSGRLANSAAVYDEYGLSLFGNFFKQIGNGGTTFVRSDVHFVDISYNLILLRYGIVMLILLNVLWVLMTRRLIRNRDYRLALVMVLIAIHAAVEHHFTEINFNILLAMPFAVMTAARPDAQSTAGTAATEVPATEYHGKHGRTDTGPSRLPVYAGWGIGAVLIGIAAFICPLLLRRARTVITLSGLSEEAEGRRLLFAASLILVMITAAGIYAIFRLLKDAVNGKAGHRILYAGLTAALVLVICASWAGTSGRVAAGMEKNIDLLEEERSAIETVQSAGGRLYAYGLPEIYNKAFGNVSTSLLDGEELARHRDTTIIFDKDIDSACFFNTGHLYTQISDEHALFTNDAKAIKALQDKGYHLTGYFPVRFTIDMAEEAADNDKTLQEDGSILLAGENEKLKKGPRTDLRGGFYTFSSELALPESDAGKKHSAEDMVCIIKIKADKGETDLFEMPVYYSQFDNAGKFTSKFRFNMPESQKVDFRILPQGDSSVIVKSMSYQKTPDYDIHATYDEAWNRVREDYYDLEGNPYTGSWGYAAKEMTYDPAGHIISEIYFDQNNEETLNTTGYCEIKRTFNVLGQDVRDEYYGVDGKRIALPAGHSAVTYTYDEYGQLIESCFFGTNDEPVLVGEEAWGGYHKATRNYDEEGRIIREDFFGLDNLPVTLKEGYSYREYEYDDNGNRIRETYYDQNGNKTPNSYGNAEVRREYDVNNRKIRESYYGSNDKQINLKTGQASTEYEYDDRGNEYQVFYYDADGKPVLVGGETWGGYYSIRRTFDIINRVAREEFLDTRGELTEVREGFASRVPLYDENNAVTGYRYYDLDGNEIKIN